MIRKLRTIRGKLTITVLLVVTIALLTLVSFIVTSANLKMVDEQKSTLKTTSKMYAEQFNTFFEQQMSFVEGIASSTILYDEYNERDVIKKVVRGYSTVVDDSVADLYIAFADKDLYMMSGSEEALPDDFDARTRSWYTQAVDAKNTIVSAPYVDQVSGNMMITIATPIYDNNTLVGVAAEDVYITELVEITRNINYASGVYGFLIDSDGNYVSHPDEALNPTADGASAADNSIIADGEDSSPELMKDYSDTDVYISSSNISKCNWTLGVALPQSYVQNQLHSMIVFSIIMSAAILVIIVFLVMLVVSQSLKPVKRMNIIYP